MPAIAGDRANQISPTGFLPQDFSHKQGHCRALNRVTVAHQTGYARAWSFIPGQARNHAQTPKLAEEKQIMKEMIFTMILQMPYNIMTHLVRNLAKVPSRTSHPS
jgi:hypothetical protein